MWDHSHWCRVSVWGIGSDTENFESQVEEHENISALWELFLFWEYFFIKYGYSLYLRIFLLMTIWFQRFRENWEIFGIISHCRTYTVFLEAIQKAFFVLIWTNLSTIFSPTYSFNFLCPEVFSAGSSRGTLSVFDPHSSVMG